MTKITMKSPPPMQIEATIIPVELFYSFITIVLEVGADACF